MGPGKGRSNIGIAPPLFQAHWRVAQRHRAALSLSNTNTLASALSAIMKGKRRLSPESTIQQANGMTFQSYDNRRVVWQCPSRCLIASQRHNTKLNLAWASEHMTPSAAEYCKSHSDPRGFCFVHFRSADPKINRAICPTANDPVRHYKFTNEGVSLEFNLRLKQAANHRKHGPDQSRYRHRSCAESLILQS